MAFNAEAKGVYSVAVTPFLENGQIDFESVDGEGTTFRLRIPLVESRLDSVPEVATRTQ